MVEPPTPLIDKLNFLVAALGLVVAGLGFRLALNTLGRGNRNSSAALVYSMQLGFQQAFESYLTETDPDHVPLKMSNILSLIETSSAIYSDTAMVGSSGQLMEEYLRDILNHIADRPELVAEVANMRHTPTTFEFLDRFIDAMAAKGHRGKFLVLRGPRPPEPEDFVYELRGGRLRTFWHNFGKPDFPGLVSLIRQRRQSLPRSTAQAAPQPHPPGANDAET